MTEHPVHRVAEWLLGADGNVAVESEAQAMTLASAILATGVVLISPLLSDLTAVYGVSEARVGLLVAVFTAPPIVLIPAAGVAADRVGRKPLLVGGLLLFGLAGAALALVASFEAALVLRGLQGVGFAAAMPLTVTVLGDIYRGSREATVQGLRTAGNFLTNMAIPLIAAGLLAASWRAPFVLFLLAVPVAVWVWITLPPTAPEASTSFRTYVKDLLTLLRRPTMALILGSFVLRFAVFYGFLTYVSILGTRTIGVETVAVGVVVSTKALLSMVGSTQAGRLVAGVHVALVVAGAFCLMAVGVGLPGVVPSLPTLLIGSAILGVGDGVVAPVQKTLVTNLVPTRLRGGAISSASSFQNIGKAAVPVVMAGVLTARGPAAVFVALGVTGLLGAALVVVVWRLTADVESLR